MTSRISRTKQILFALVPLVLLLAAAEFVFRMFPHKDSGRTVAGFAEPDENLIWRLKPLDSGRYQTNALNLRDTPYNADADIKILLLGDSISWGDGVDLELGYPFLLEQRLNQLDPKRTYEVINTGVPGYSTYQQATYLELQGLQLEPDLVVLQFCLNDVVERYHSDIAYGGDNEFLGVDTRVGLSGLTGFLVRHSRASERLLRFLQNRSRDRQEFDVQNMARDELSPALNEAWQRTESEIAEIQRIAAHAGIPLLLVIAPYQFQFVEIEKQNQPQRRLVAFAEGRDLPYVDLLPGLWQATLRDLVYPRQLFNDANHFSPHGHDAVASLLVEPVQRVLEANAAKPDAGMTRR